MQTFNQSPRSARSRGTPIRPPPISTPRDSILDSPSGRSPPRRGILRQPNSSRRTLRQATISPTPPRIRRQSNRMPELSQEQVHEQLVALYITIRSLVTQSIEYEEAEDEVTGLQGHQDLKDMFAEVGDLGFVPGTRRLLDMLELIQSKKDALAQAMIEEAEDNELAEAETDTGSEAESESDSDDEPSGPSYSDDSYDDEPFQPSQDPLGDDYDWSNVSPPTPRRQRPRNSFFDSDDESDSDESVDLDLLARADTEPPSLRF